MKVTKTYLSLILATGLSGALLPGCTTSPPTEEARDNLRDDANTSLNEMKRADNGMDDFLKNSAAYVIFPNVGKGGAGVGGAYGRGEVYEHGKFVGYADLSQGTVGAELGGQTYSELIVFQNKDTLDRFENNKLEFEASASAVALRSGASTDAKYTNGVVVFTKPLGGLMFDASIGGQQFTFKAAADRQ